MGFPIENQAGGLPVRQAIILVVGLLLIAIWGVVLRHAIHGTHAVDTHAVDTPAPVPALSAAKQLANASKSNSAWNQNDQSFVTQASFMTPPPDEPQLVSIIDKLDGRGIFWNAEQMSKSPIWLRSQNIELSFQFVQRPAAQQEQTPFAIDASNVGNATKISNNIQWIDDKLTFTFDLTEIRSNDFQFVLKTTKNFGNGTYSFEGKLEPANGSAVRIRKSRLGAPYAPTVQETRLGVNYPWQAVPNDKRIPAKLYFGKSSSIGAKVIAYDKTNALIGIAYGVPSDNASPLEVISVNMTTAKEDGEHFVLQNTVTTGEGKYATLQVHYAAANNLALEANHTFGNQLVEVTFIPMLSPQLNTTISRVAGKEKNADASRFYTTTQKGTPPIAVRINTGATTLVDDSIACQLFRNGSPISESVLVKDSGCTFNSTRMIEGLNVVEARLFAGDSKLDKSISTPADIEVQTNGFRITEVGPDAFGTVIGLTDITLRFSRDLDTNVETPKDTDNSRLRVIFSPDGRFTANAANKLIKPNVKFSADSKSAVIVTPAELKQGYYQITVIGSDLKDPYGNVLENAEGVIGGNYVKVLGGAAQIAADAYPVIPGVTRGNAPMVEYPEFVQPRKVPNGFNPNDKVETRVARLYFYRDAHRVAQILNRRVQSYNRQEVAVRRQLADKARQEADSRTSNRMISERAAVQAAQRTRELENQLSDTQRSLNSTLQQLQSAASQPPAADEAGRQRQQQVIDQLQTAARSFAQQSETLEAQVRSARDAEVAANERWQQTQREEDLARTDQFRMETAAAHSDPDTFAEGKPNSDDPVAQVSISVIGEGLIHLRGPLKGVNQVRLMVDQIDSPQGQVRINVHSTQINGDEADELEVVANRIQTYIDQARFLTVQSAEMLRKAVIHIAALRAEEARGLHPQASQAERDQLYLHAFFGTDFVNELQSMDSELLQTGNKLLSLHSMDVTSLSSALMLLALANNGTRLAILEEFQRLLQSDLTSAEQQFIQNGLGACVGGCKKGCKHQHHGPPICNLACNSTFTSLKGFFNSQLQQNDTMSPLQHETIALAQILKARLITEMEYKQRVMERAVIEERAQAIENTDAQLVRERNAEEQVRRAREAQVNARSVVLPNLTKSAAILEDVTSVLQTVDVAIEGLAEFLYENEIAKVNGGNRQDAIELALRQVLQRIENYNSARDNHSTGSKAIDKGELGFSRQLYRVNADIAKQAFGTQESPRGTDAEYILYVEAQDKSVVLRRLQELNRALLQAQSVGRTFHSETSQTSKDLENLTLGVTRLTSRQGIFPTIGELEPVASVYEIKMAIQLLLKLIQESRDFQRKAAEIQSAREAFLVAFARFSNNQDTGANLEKATEIFRLWTRIQTSANRLFDPDVTNDTKRVALQQAANSTRALEEWIEAISKLDAAQSIAQDSRRPLDHKKFLDMLIDELEEKYIELLEGTRAHTANIDNYLKRLTTALDDDFNTQYYYPVFRLVREASQYKRVEFGQTETTNLLVNNREFGKVSPSASMEFDLPKRDILIKEGLDSALAIYNDVGALVKDPNLLALAKMQSGNSAASPGAGTLGGMGAIRNVLPGLQSDSAEQLLAQNAGSGPKFESNVEKLIPDPAIYKFETGTGYEIRPVIAPDGQAVVFDFHYLYSTQIREPVRADEKHLGRVKQHFIDTDVHLSNFELREVSRYVVALKAERTANGVPLLEDIPVVGALWRPLPNREKSLQQNIIMAQATIFPTLFDLMGLRWAPAISDLDPLKLSNREYLVRGRHQYLENRIYDYSSARVDEFLRIPDDARRTDLYRSQETIPSVHPNGYRGRGLDYENSQMREGYNPEEAHVSPGYIPARSPEGAMYLPGRQSNLYEQMPQGAMPTEAQRSLEFEHASPTRSLTPKASPVVPNRIPTPPQLNETSSSRRSDGWQYQRSN